MGRYSRPLAVPFADFAGLPLDGRVVDVGCGPGALTAELARRARPGRVTAVDPSEEFVAALRTTIGGRRDDAPVARIFRVWQPSIGRLPSASELAWCLPRCRLNGRKRPISRRVRIPYAPLFRVGARALAGAPLVSPRRREDLCGKLLPLRSSGGPSPELRTATQRTRPRTLSSSTSSRGPTSRRPR